MSFLQKSGGSRSTGTRQRELGQFKKEYFALVHGVPEQRTGSIRMGIAGVPGSLMKTDGYRNGKHAVNTRYRKCRSFSAVRVLLETGGRIRSASTWPIGQALGDKIYAVSGG